MMNFMADILQTLKLYFTFPFVQYAMVAGVLIALCSSLLGVTLVLKRFSYIGDGLSHVAFGALSVATVLKLSNNMFLILPATVICAIILLSTGRNAKIKGDAAVAMLSVSALAVGYFLVNMFSASANISGDVCTTLFGSTSILTLTKTDVYLCVVLSMLVIAVFLLFYHKIFSVTFDENFARATGIKTNVYNLIIAIIIAVVIVLAMNLVGSLLISALIVFPSLSSMRLFKNFKSVIIFSALVSVLCSVFGIVFSILLETPVGATIVITDLLVFLICRLVEKLKAAKKI